MKLNFVVMTAVMACSELAAAGAVGAISARTDAIPAVQWLGATCKPARDDGTKYFCGKDVEVKRTTCEERCSCVRSSDPSQIADGIQCQGLGSCQGPKLKEICSCTGEAGSGACGNGGHGLG